MVEFSKRALNITPSATLSLSAKAKEMQAQGLKVLNLSIGEPDFETPDFIKQAAIQAITQDKANSYTPAAGIPELRQAVAQRTNLDYGTDYVAENVVITTGGKLALYALAQVLLNPGDEVLIPLPYWVSYGEQVKLAEAKPVFVQPSQNLKVTVADLEAKRTDHTKLLILNTPQNPAGLIYSREELEAIGNWAVNHKILLLADDMYGKLVYNGNRFVSLVELSAEIQANTILVNGLSKAYAMTGWRVGYVVASQEVSAKLTAFLGHVTSNITAASQYAALAAVTGDQSCVEEMRKEYEARLNLIYPMFENLVGFEVGPKPEGAFYLFPNVKGAVEACGFDSTNDFVAALLAEQQVVIVPGEAFGMEDCVRISYAADRATLEEAINRIYKFIQIHQQ